MSATSGWNRAPGTRILRLVVEYDGTDFRGWQRQPGVRTVQGEIEEVLRAVLQEPVAIVGAGRTDAGVHAEGQVASFRTRSALPALRIQGALRGLLPADVTLKKAEDAPAGFHARRDAVARTYRYRIFRGASALERRRAWTLPGDLDVALLRGQAALLPGEHDFTPFAKAGAVQAAGDGVLRIRRARWTASGRRLSFTIEADRFLHRVVRNLVGAMVAAARGEADPEELGRLLENPGLRRRRPTAAPPEGLTLVRVAYPGGGPSR